MYTTDFETPFQDALENALVRRATDAAKNGKAYTLRALVPNAAAGSPGDAYGTSQALIRIDTEGGFLWTGISGQALGPVDSSGIRSFGSTSFPAPGSGTGNNNYPAIADRGVSVSVADVTGRQLTNLKVAFNSLPAPAPVGNLLCPGYGFEPYFAPLPEAIYLPTGTTLVFTFYNHDHGAGEFPLYHRVDLLLSGDRYVRN